MKYVWLVIETITEKVIAAYDEKEIAEKLAPVLAQKFETETRVERRTVNLELTQIGTRL